jgi:hypothetical protein
MLSLPAELCSITDESLRQLSRSPPQRTAEFIETIPIETRSPLALYCYSQSSLRSLGVAIAATCSQDDLWWSGGKIGMELASKAKEWRAIKKSATASESLRPIFAARGLTKAT